MKGFVKRGHTITTTIIIPFNPPPPPPVRSGLHPRPPTPPRYHAHFMTMLLRLLAYHLELRPHVLMHAICSCIESLKVQDTRSCIKSQSKQRSLLEMRVYCRKDRCVEAPVRCGCLLPLPSAVWCSASAGVRAGVQAGAGCGAPVKKPLYLRFGREKGEARLLTRSLRRAGCGNGAYPRPRVFQGRHSSPSRASPPDRISSGALPELQHFSCSTCMQLKGRCGRNPLAGSGY